MPTSAPDTARPAAAVDAPGDAMLSLSGVIAGYGGFDILHGIDLHVHRGEIVTVVGPNGSGKSTVFNAIYGLIDIAMAKCTSSARTSPRWGRRPAATRPGDGASLSTIFPYLSVYENLELGMYLVRDKPRIKARIQEMFELFPRLAERRDQPAGTLSGGERRALEISRSLMLEPRMILMDEPSVNLSPILAKNLFQQLRELRDSAGLTFLLIEQNARSALELADRGYVIQRGRVSHTGTGASLLRDAEVRGAFLGG